MLWRAAEAHAARRTLTSRLWYGLASDEFSRETRAVLAGRAAYDTASSDQVGNQFLLRRNTHRLEKGLLMRPRRAVFATQYIEETVSAFAEVLAARSEGADDRDMRWSQDVLDLYFDVVGAHPRVRRARDTYEQVARPVPLDGSRRVPYRRVLDQAPPVAFADFARLSRQRRSVRWFLPESVPRDLLDEAITVALEAPSACNRQPFRMQIFDDPALVQRVAALPRGTPGYAHNIPVIIVFIGQLRAFFGERDRHLIYVDASLAAMSLMLALETAGLASCPTNPESTVQPRGTGGGGSTENAS